MKCVSRIGGGLVAAERMRRMANKTATHSSFVFTWYSAISNQSFDLLYRAPSYQTLVESADETLAFEFRCHCATCVLMSFISGMCSPENIAADVRLLNDGEISNRLGTRVNPGEVLASIAPSDCVQCHVCIRSIDSFNYSKLLIIVLSLHQNDAVPHVRSRSFSLSLVSSNFTVINKIKSTGTAIRLRGGATTDGCDTTEKAKLQVRLPSDRAALLRSPSDFSPPTTTAGR